jgi:hypothetical protein
MGSGHIDPRFLDLCISWRCGQLDSPAALFLGKEPPVANGKEAVWAPEPVWTTWRKFLTLPELELRPIL